MISEFDKDYIPIWCDDCDCQGFVFINDTPHSYFVVCNTCKWETSQVWCPKCEIGGEFVRDISKQPSEWSCPGCNTKYKLPDNFYENPIKLIAQQELPPIIQERIKRDFETSQTGSHKIKLYNVLVLIVYIIIFLLPIIFLSFAVLKRAPVVGLITIILFPLWIILIDKLGRKYLHKLYKQ
jgi:hypothetical protein